MFKKVEKEIELSNIQGEVYSKAIERIQDKML